VDEGEFGLGMVALELVEVTLRFPLLLSREDRLMGRGFRRMEVDCFGELICWLRCWLRCLVR
jgi:hypothetical protein